MEAVKPGKFIVFEGGEGSGKTTSVGRAVDYLNSKGIEVVRTREPGGTQGAEAIRSILITEGMDFDPVANALLFAAARRDHVMKVIKPAIDRGAWVISDRFVLSTLAYQGAEGLDASVIKIVHNLSVDGLLPDLTIFMDVDPQIGVTRSMKRLGSEASNENRFENYDLGFHERVRRIMTAYNWSPKVTIDANQSIESVVSDVKVALSVFECNTRIP